MLCYLHWCCDVLCTVVHFGLQQHVDECSQMKPMASSPNSPPLLRSVCKGLSLLLMSSRWARMMTLIFGLFFTMMCWSSAKCHINMAESDYFFEIIHEQRNVLCCWPACSQALALIIHFSHLDCLSVWFLIFFFPGISGQWAAPPFHWSSSRRSLRDCRHATLSSETRRAHSLAFYCSVVSSLNHWRAHARTHSF